MSEMVDYLKEGTKFIEFCLGEENYAIPLLHVREVISVTETTLIPNAPSYFVGIMNLRGQVITIIDLRKKLNIKPMQHNKEEAVIIVNAGGLHIGLTVDSINKVMEIDSSDQVDTLPELQTQVNAKYIAGVYKKEKSLTIILNINDVLDVKSIQKLTQKAA
jgi:purine-binding chemotaxis protein CheW